MELSKKEYCLRLRDISEETNEDIRERIVTLLATFLQKEQEDVETEINKVYMILDLLKQEMPQGTY